MSDNRTPIRVGFYDIEKTIGKGNFAVVKLARHRLTKNEVAIKIIDKTQLQPADLRRAYREVRVLKKLYHPHIIRLYQVMETKNMLYLVTEYAPKGEIFEHIANHGRLPEPFARRIYWQVVSAVDYCHKRGVVHRDLKAENLLFDAEGCVKLADFGFSTWWSQDQMLSTWCGSPPYAAPEVFEGRQYVGPEIDIWSLGVVLYVLVCGALPFDASTLPALRERVLSARYRIPYFMSAECEALVRNMLKRDPARRFTIDQVKQHAWMQADRPPRLLPAPGQPTQAASHKQYLDPGLAPDVLEPNEQILRLMASLGIDSSRTKESLKQQSYDHHAAIYFLLLERLRQHPGGKLAGSSMGRPAPGAVRMMSTDSSTCRKMPRRPSTIAETAMRKMGPGPSSECQPGQSKAQQSVAGAAGPAPVPSQEQAAYWRVHRAMHAKVGQSQNSSVDEGVADMDSTWEPGDFSGSIGTIDRGSTSSSGFVLSMASGTGTSRTDWKWPAAGCSGYSIPTSSDSPRASGSPGESVHGSSTTLSSWDSAWEPASMAMSLPSCSQQQNQPPSATVDSRRMSVAESEAARSPESTLTTGRLWLPEMNNPPLAPEFQLGRRASDGLIGGRRVAPFTNKLEGARAGGITTLTEMDNPSEMNSPTAVEEGCLEEKLLPDSQFLVLCSPAKRPSLPDAKKVLPNGMMPPPVREPGTSQQWTSPGTFHLHKQLMSLRLQRRTGGSVDQSDIAAAAAAAEPMETTRRSVLRQQSYKLAQQQPVMSPLHGQNLPFLPPDLESCIFRPICPEETRLHSHEEEQEEEDDDDVGGGGGTHRGGVGNRETPDLSRTSPWPGKETAWQTLPVTMGDCKLTDSNTSLSRLSPLLQYSDYQPSSSTATSSMSGTLSTTAATSSTGAYPYDWTSTNPSSTSVPTFLPPSTQSSMGHSNILPRQ